MKMAESFPKGLKTQWEKGISRNSVFKRLVLQTCKKKGSFWKGKVMYFTLYQTKTFLD